MKLPFEGQFAENNFFAMTNKKIKEKLEKNFSSEYCKIVNIKYMKETAKYVLFKGLQTDYVEPEKKKIIVDIGGNFWVIPFKDNIIRPFSHLRQSDIYGYGNISSVR